MKGKKEKKSEETLGIKSEGLVIEENTEKVSALEKQLKEAESKYLLLYADFENYKRRVQKDKDEIKSNTKVSMLNSILDMDNDIVHAIKSIKDEDAKKGVELIANKIGTFLKSNGIEPIQTLSYDEDLHEVISVLDIGESKIIEVVSKGYTMDGKPFRFPKIVLGK